MKSWRLICILLTSLIWTNANTNAKPNSSYPDVITLLEKKRDDLKAKLIRTPYRPSYWKKYGDAKKMLYLFRSARVLENVHFPATRSKKVSNRTYDTAYNTVHLCLYKIQRNMRDSVRARCGESNFDEDQALLDERMLQLNTIGFAKILSEANRTIPPTCGDPEKGIAHIDFYNLEYKVRNRSRYNKDLSYLEEEILQEYADLKKKPKSDIFDGIQVEIESHLKKPQSNDRHNEGKTHQSKPKTTKPKKHKQTRRLNIARAFASTPAAQGPIDHECFLPGLPRTVGLPRKSTRKLSNVQEFTSEEQDDSADRDSDVTTALAQLEQESDSDNEDALNDRTLQMSSTRERARQSSYAQDLQPPTSDNTALNSYPARLPGYVPSVIYRTAPETGVQEWSADPLRAGCLTSTTPRLATVKVVYSSDSREKHDHPKG